MKKSKNKLKIETPSISITATLEEADIMKCLIEEIACCRFEMGYNLEKVQPGWQAIETSSLEADVSGNLNLSEKTGLINMSFGTCFLFTCIKEEGNEYSLNWASSLS